MGYEIIDNGNLAFDHAKIISIAFGIIQNCANNFEILFDFMPELFTLTGMQRVQETILGIKLTPANFRRKIMPFVQETDEVVSGAGHRPAKLFKKKNNQ